MTLTGPDPKGTPHDADLEATALTGVGQRSLLRRPARRRGGGRANIGAGSRWFAFVASPGRILGVGIITFFVLMAVFGPMLYPQNLPANANLIYAAPSWHHLLGTDFEGTDILSEIVVGSRYVLSSAAVAGIVTVVLGTTVGLLAGYRRGLADSALMRVTDFVLTVPGFPLLIVLSAVWHFTSPFEMGFVLGITGWGGIARAVRSQALSLRERPFVEAARSLGVPTRLIVWRELLPNVAPYVGMNALVSMVIAVYSEVGLFFLGVLPLNVDNWGVMLNLAVNEGNATSSTQALPYLLSPLVCVLLLTLGSVLLLDAVDEVFNPRLRRW